MNEEYPKDSDNQKQQKEAMHTTNLRKVGGSVMLVIPPAFLEQLNLQSGAIVELAIDEGRLVVQAKPKQRYDLAQLMTEMQNGQPRVDGWDEMHSVGLENP